MRSTLIDGRRALIALSISLFLHTNVLSAQASSSRSEAELPDAPRPLVSLEVVHEQTPEQTSKQASTQNSPASSPVFKIGPWRDPKSLDLSMPVEPLTVSEKLKLSFHEQVTPFALASTVFAAGWEQLVDSNPKYGSNSTAFAQRVGAAALRQTSQAVFSDGVFASAFHQDPRYYRLVNGSFRERIFYAASRTFRSRTDSGEPVTNYSLLFGHATAQALTLTYYPDRSQTGRVAITGFAWSLLGSMLGNQYHEFWPDILQAVFQTPPAAPKPATLPAESRQVSHH